MAEIGPAFRRVRRLRGLKQSRAAELLGVSQASLSRWETGALKPSAAAAARMAALMTAPRSSDHALKRLVSGASVPVHLVCDATHALLAASAPRVAGWRRSVGETLGESLWRYASEEIERMEARLADLGWSEPAAPALAFWTGANGDATVPIRPGLTLWERLTLDDGRPARLVTTVASPPDHAVLVPAVGG